MSDITIFICEDEAVREEITKKYLEEGKVTYAGILPKEARKTVVDKLDEVYDLYERNHKRKSKNT